MTVIIMGLGLFMALVIAVLVGVIWAALELSERSFNDADMRRMGAVMALVLVAGGFVVALEESADPKAEIECVEGE